MIPLLIPGGDTTTGIVLDKKLNKFEITGVSLPENVYDFFFPVLTWINDYCLHPNPKTEFHIKLNYFNTASSKIIIEILSILECLPAQGLEVEVIWHYLEMDEDMRSTGREFDSMLKVPFRYVAYV
jgi:hypothetical protein